VRRFLTTYADFRYVNIDDRWRHFDFEESRVNFAERTRTVVQGYRFVCLLRTVILADMCICDVLDATAANRFSIRPTESSHCSFKVVIIYIKDQFYRFYRHAIESISLFLIICLLRSRLTHHIYINLQGRLCTISTRIGSLAQRYQFISVLTWWIWLDNYFTMLRSWCRKTQNSCSICMYRYV
jgi:hypothetical protein